MTNGPAISTETASTAQLAFFARLGGAQPFRELFDMLPDVQFFAKDKGGRFIAGSIALLRRLGLASEAQLIGLTDMDIHPKKVAETIRADDLQIMKTGTPLAGRIEALFTRSQAKDWYLTTKLPIRDATGGIVGIMGFVRPYRFSEGMLPGAERLGRVVAHIQEHHAKSLEAVALAKLGGVSERQLRRMFQEAFGMSPQAFLIRTRVQAASDDLLLTDQTLSEIALEHGFSDQSAFSRRFIEHTGETPLKFRRRHRAECE
jgi:AraC-like DNA-binding protein